MLGSKKKSQRDEKRIALDSEAGELFRSNFEEFEKSLSSQEPSWLHPIRKKAFSRFTELGFPTIKDEEWKYTSVNPLTEVNFQLANSKFDNLVLEDLKGVAPLNISGTRLVFINGIYNPQLSLIQPLPQGVKVGSLASFLLSEPQLIRPYLAKYAAVDKQAFTALNTGFIREGAFIYLPKGSSIEEPIYLFFISTAPSKPTVSHPRNLIIAEENSRASLVELYTGLSNDVYFTNAVTEIVAGANTEIQHYKLERESEKAFHIATLEVDQNYRSHFVSYSIATGGRLVRNQIHASLGSEDVECTLNGLYMTKGDQHIDHHTRIDHKKARGTSHELYKGILDGNSTGVFNGKIFVWQDAQKTDAKQTNKNLLLSDKATINTKPQLEIFADDVKCTHGATIGYLDEDAIFYLRSRGMSENSARNILIHAFANDIVQRVKIEPLKPYLEKLILNRLSGIIS